MKTTLYVKNLKCANCEVIIINVLSKIKNISNVFIKNKYATVTFEHTSPKDVEVIKITLSKIGYPPFGEKNNFTKRKTYLSHAANLNEK
ncbi:heavy-metal-associated domain-containing protein [Yeosuana marina]|uniref:heavy-metal-associated domain-containing protein n=1 Tax=Yeosuana marina TaxID=1565536 RepID=UPI00141EEF51|nr:cation transporter [Yeosuana marina]|tara:strand:- start:534 stop:800 length:267 start_codon:yes stop_codon:yes gene_type:complete